MYKSQEKQGQRRFKVLQEKKVVEICLKILRKMEKNQHIIDPQMHNTLKNVLKLKFIT